MVQLELWTSYHYIDALRETGVQDGRALTCSRDACVP